MNDLKVVRLENGVSLDLNILAEKLTELKALASRTPTPVTVAELETIIASDKLHSLFLQLYENEVVGWCSITVSPFEDRAHIGPIAVIKPHGKGTPLIETAISDTWHRFSNVRRIDLTNRPDHDLEAWYSKFGFVPRTEAAGDPTTVFRLTRS